jgi:hypothetical protein
VPKKQSDPCRAQRRAAFESQNRLASVGRFCSNDRFFTLKIVDATTIEVAEGNISTRFFQCSPNTPSL